MSFLPPLALIHFPCPRRAALLLASFVVFLAGSPRGHADAYTDDFERPDSENRVIGGEWLTRGDMRVANNALEILANKDGHKACIEAISQTEEMAHGDGRSFELGVDLFVTNPASEERSGLLFNWQDAADYYSLLFTQNKLTFLASRSGQGVGDHSYPVPNVAANTWYRLTVSSSEAGSAQFKFATVGDHPQVLVSGTIALPDPPLTGGSGGVQAVSGNMKFDNFSLTTSP